MTRSCVIEGCGKPRVGRGWCRTHYQRWSRHGDPTITLKAGNGTHQGCQVPGCEKPHCGGGYCEMHRLRVKKHGDPDAIRYATGPRPQMRGAANSQWRGDDCGYDAAHDRLKIRRGPANTHPCAHCQATADEWAYDHADPGERTATGRHDHPYSLDPAHYLPLCVPCHRLFDAPRKAVV